jgi:hypothetical protein
MSANEFSLSEESMQILRALRQSDGRLHGRFDRDAPFLRTDPTNPDPDWRERVPVAFAEELFEAGLIEIDDAAPIRDIYAFQVSNEGKEFLTADL